MNDINKLGKITEIIGKLLFGLLVIILMVAGFAMQLTKYQNKDFSDKIAVMVGAIVGVIILFFILRLIFRPIYNLNKNIQLRKEGKLTSQQFKTTWLISLICSIIISVLSIIPTFAVSVVFMVPQFLLLYNSKRELIQYDSLSNFKDVNTIREKISSNTDSFKFNIKNMTKQEQLILITIIGVIIGLILGYVTGEHQYYNALGRRINVNNINDNSVKLFKFNYLLFFCGFIVSSGISYMLISRISKKQ